MTGRWITMDWDRHCRLWAGSIPPRWDEEQGRYDCDPETFEPESARISESLAKRLTGRQYIMPGDITEVIVTKLKTKTIHT